MARTMRQAIAPATLRRVYERLAPRYDREHGLLTLHNDERGRRLAVGRAVRRGDRVLDAGAGTGSSALLAAAAVGTEGHVTLLDASPAMLAEAQRKARAVRLEERMSFVGGDILRLPFPDATFDAVLSTYSVCPLVDPVAGALELYRALRPGGRLGIAHSATPRTAVMHWMAERLEDVVWRWPGISMGCRAVEVLPDLLAAGARLLDERRLGIPLYPFEVFAVEKPAARAGEPST